MYSTEALLDMPSRVFLRTQPHYYQHQGQVLAACRILGHPSSGFDLPIR